MAQAAQNQSGTTVNPSRRPPAAQYQYVPPRSQKASDNLRDNGATQSFCSVVRTEGPNAPLFSRTVNGNCSGQRDRVPACQVVTCFGHLQCQIASVLSQQRSRIKSSPRLLRDAGCKSFVGREAQYVPTPTIDRPVVDCDWSDFLLWPALQGNHLE